MQLEAQTLAAAAKALGVSGSRDVSSLRCDFGRHVSPDVSSLILNLKSKHLISGAASNLHDVVKLMDGCQESILCASFLEFLSNFS